MNNKITWYLEYEISQDRVGLLGDISSLIGMMGINIITINGVDNMRRGMLLQADSKDSIDKVEIILSTLEHITVTKSRIPTLRDKLALQHGRYIQRDGDDIKTFRFVRDELGILVDFMAELFKKQGSKVIGIRGMPRVGKTESIVAASVCANKRWLFVSSTLIKQTIRNQLIKEEYNPNHVFIIDGIVTVTRANEKHWQLVREVMRMPSIKVIEHPDIFVQRSEYTLQDFDYIIELRNNDEEEITYDIIENPKWNHSEGFSMFDF